MDCIRLGQGPDEVVICSQWYLASFEPHVFLTAHDEDHEWAKLSVTGEDHARSVIGHGSEKVGRMRSFLAEDGECNVLRLTDQQVIDQIASELAQGRLVLFRQVLTEEAKARFSWHSAPPKPLPATVWPSSHRARRDDDVPTHWIEIQMIGEDDNPIAGEAYTVKLPNGALITGRLDENGWARIESISSAGECHISFPRLDRRAWSKV